MRFRHDPEGDFGRIRRQHQVVTLLTQRMKDPTVIFRLGELFDVELDDHDVETVGGLLAQQLGRVPLPGAEAEIEGLSMLAEGGKDSRGRMRITSVVVRSRKPSNRERERSAERG